MPMVLFNSEKARKHLLEKKFVYTVRSRRKENGFYSAYQTDGGKKFIGVVYLEFVKVVTRPDDLAEFVKDSGFNSVEEWLKELKRSNCGFPAFLYKATLHKHEKFWR